MGVAPTSSPDRLGSVIAGRYRLERELGAGGMGDVYVAVQEPLGRQVALKLMRAGLVGPAAQRFEREARSLAATTHPNIVTIFDYGRTDGGELFMAMELVRGVTLREHMARTGRLSPAQALPIVVDICRALEATHRAGIVHRDLKPENVMLVDHSGGTLTAKVLDFGIARLHDPDGTDDAPKLTQTGHLVGTPGYMAPETVLEAVFDDPRSDLYAVGVILWELLTNCSLFQAPTPIALVMKHALDPPPSLSATLASTTPPHAALEALLDGLLHKNRHQRFASATAVIEAIAAMPPSALGPIVAGQHAPIVNIDPSAPTMAATRGTMPTPAVVARSSSSIMPPSSSAIVAPVTTTMAPARTSPVLIALVALVAVLVVVVVIILATVLRPSPTVVLTPPPIAPPVVAAPVVTAPVVTAPVAPVAPRKPRPSATKPKPKKPTKPTKPTSPHVPDLD